VLAVLEGGYSDRALASASAAFLTGLVGGAEEGEEEQKTENAWWDEANLVKLEKACAAAKPRRGAGASGFVGAGSGSGLVGAPPPSKSPKSAADGNDHWLSRAVEIFAHIEPPSSFSPPPITAAPRPPKIKDEPKPMQLRTRKVRHDYAGLDDGSTPVASPTGGRRAVSTPAPRATKETIPAAALPPLPPPVPLSSTLDAPAPPSTLEEALAAPAAPPKPKIKFTWKQGGFGGEPRM
jgi:hypothetical protein